MKFACNRPVWAPKAAKRGLTEPTSFGEVMIGRSTERKGQPSTRPSQRTSQKPFSEQNRGTVGQYFQCAKRKAINVIAHSDSQKLSVSMVPNLALAKINLGHAMLIKKLVN